MKIVVAILTSIVVTFAVTWAAVSGKEQVVVERQAEERRTDTDDQLAKLRRQLQAAKAEAGRVEIVREQIIVPGA